MSRATTTAALGGWIVFGMAVGSLLGCASDPLDSSHNVSEKPTANGYTAHYRATVENSNEPLTVPPVLLTKDHEALCQVMVGDAMPAIELPAAAGGQTKLSDLYGRGATVVLFWKSDRRMTRTALADMGPDVVEPFAAAGVTVVSIAVDETARDARTAMRDADASFPVLVDSGGEAFAKVGQDKLPRVYLLDAEGTVIWFDIEYSLTTRRELHRALVATVGSEQ